MHDAKKTKYVVEGDKLQILKYSAYAVGIPLFVTLVTLVVEFLPEDYGGIRPGFGTSTCFFKSNLGNLLFFHILLMALEVTNAVFFIIVAANLHKNWKFSKQVGMKQSSIRNGTHKSPTFKGIIIKYFLNYIIVKRDETFEISNS